jgi:tetratricopeptide (TPR) repeat protein
MPSSLAVCALKGSVAAGTDIEPRFAERASGLLDRGDVPAALSLLLAGMKQYPAYATAHVLLGQCYERLGKVQDAAQQFTQARRILPGLTGIGAASQPAADSENGVDFMLRQLPHVKIRPDAAMQLETGTPAPTGTDDGAGSEPTAPIVSVTLAEIYAEQGRYREAAEAYSRLAQQRPAEAGRYRERLAELERLLQGVDKLGEA